MLHACPFFLGAAQRRGLLLRVSSGASQLTREYSRAQARKGYLRLLQATSRAVSNLGRDPSTKKDASPRGPASLIRNGCCASLATIHHYAAIATGLIPRPRSGALQPAERQGGPRLEKEQRTILVVAEDAAAAKRVGEYLQLGVRRREIVTAQSGAGALDVGRASSLDLVLVDETLADMTVGAWLPSRASTCGCPRSSCDREARKCQVRLSPCGRQRPPPGSRAGAPAAHPR
jgi:hypothetical protein